MVNQNKGITLIALIVTIIILLILAGVATNYFLGDNGLLETTKWAAYVTEYEGVNEKISVYTAEILIKQYSGINKIASTGNVGMETKQVLKNMYPLKEKIDINSVSATLKQSIKQLEGLKNKDLQDETLVDLYKIDLDYLQMKTQKQYVINIVSGKIYSLEYQKYQGKVYHTPRKETGLKPTFQEIIMQIEDEGTYEMIVDAGQVVDWESVVIDYQKYIENGLSIQVATSDDGIAWQKESIELTNRIQDEELYTILANHKTQYLKVNIEVKSINGKLPELNYILVNFYKFNLVDTEVTVMPDGAEETDGMYVVSTKGQTETVTQIFTIPDDENEYILDIGKAYGNPATTIKITDTDGNTENYTIKDISDIKNILIKPGSQIEITTTLTEGEGIGKVQVLKKDKDLTKEQVKTIEVIPSTPVGTKVWETQATKTYMYNNGGEGYWQQCLVNEISVGEKGIIDQGETKRIKVTYQVSEDGKQWSNKFTNIQDAENTRYLKVMVEYQATKGTDYGDTSNNKIKVILNDGSWKITFADEDGTILFYKRVYFEKTNQQGTLTLPNYPNAIGNREFMCWKEGDAQYLPNSTYTATQNITLTAYYIIPELEASARSIGPFSFYVDIATNCTDTMIDKFIYYINGEDKNLKYETKDKTYNVTGLDLGTAYKVYVEAKTISGNTITSDEIDVTTATEINLIQNGVLVNNDYHLSFGSYSSVTLTQKDGYVRLYMRGSQALCTGVYWNITYPEGKQLKLVCDLSNPGGDTSSGAGYVFAGKRGNNNQNAGGKPNGYLASWTIGGTNFSKFTQRKTYTSKLFVAPSGSFDVGLWITGSSGYTYEREFYIYELKIME